MKDPITSPLRVPQPWCVGPFDPATGELLRPEQVPLTEITIYPPGHQYPYLQFGKKDGTVVITHNGTVVGILCPSEIRVIVDFWAANGVVV